MKATRPSTAFLLTARKFIMCGASLVAKAGRCPHSGEIPSESSPVVLWYLRQMADQFFTSSSQREQSYAQKNRAWVKKRSIASVQKPCLRGGFCPIPTAITYWC